MRQALSAWTQAARGSRPQASSTRDQAMRKARNFEIVASSSASAARRNAMSARASPGGVPVSSKSRNTLTAAASAKASSWAEAPAGRMDPARVGDQERPPETPVPQCERSLDSAPRLTPPVAWKRSAGRGGARIEPERDPQSSGLAPERSIRAPKRSA